MTKSVLSQDDLDNVVMKYFQQVAQGQTLVSIEAKTGYERYLEFNKNYDTKDDYKAIADWYSQNKATLQKGVYASENVVTMFYQKIMGFMGGQVPKQPNEQGFNALDAKFHNYLHGLPMFSAWRNSLSIYRIDPDIFSEMLKTPLPDDTPSDIFFNLPDFCVYIEFPNPVKYTDFDEFPPHPMGVNNAEIAGFWAYPIQKSDRENNRIELDLCPNVINTPLPLFDNNSIVLQKGLTVEQAFMATWDCYNLDPKTRDMSINYDRALIKRLLAMLLWLCVEQPDIIGANGEPLPTNQNRYQRHKKTGYFVPPNQPKVYNIGQRLGGEIRQYKQQIADHERTKTGASKRPHIRRGHWHGYWTGTGQDKQFTPKWLSATFVNA